MAKLTAILSFGAGLIIATSAAAQTPLTVEEFEAYVKGRTLTFATEDGPYGIEEYLPEREVRWARINGKCARGKYFQQGSDICFLYDGDPEPKCWYMELVDDQLVVEFTTRPSLRLYEVIESNDPLICEEPDALSKR